MPIDPIQVIASARETWPGALGILLQRLAYLIVLTAGLFLFLDTKSGQYFSNWILSNPLKAILMMVMAAGLLCGWYLRLSKQELDKARNHSWIFPRIEKDKRFGVEWASWLRSDPNTGIESIGISEPLCPKCDAPIFGIPNKLVWNCPSEACAAPYDCGIPWPHAKEMIRRDLIGRY